VSDTPTGAEMDASVMTSGLEQIVRFTQVTVIQNAKVVMDFHCLGPENLNASLAPKMPTE